MPRRDWDVFLEESIWAPPRKAKVEVGGVTSPSAAPDAVRHTFPKLCELMARARVTPVRVNDEPHRLLAWDAPEGTPMGWFCRDASDHDNVIPLHADHCLLATHFGGIVERFNEPQSWLLNLNEAITLRLAREPLHHADFAPPFDAESLPLPIELNEWYAIAQEANGNVTICQRETGDVLMFAPDHAFDHVVPLEGCPPYTFYRIRGAPTFAGWVETVARQWLDAVNNV